MIRDDQAKRRFLIADGHSLDRSDLRSIINKLAGEGIEVLEAESFDQAMQIIREKIEFELVIVDAQLVEPIASAGLKKIKDFDSKIPVVLISSGNKWDFVFPALRLGASGFISKDYGEAIVINALRLILSGGVFIPYQAFESRAIHGSVTTPPKNNENDHYVIGNERLGGVEKISIAPRQRDILRLMLTGQSNKEIARSLGLALGTVKNQVAVILRALNANNRSQAILNAIKVGAAGEKLELLSGTSGRRDF